ncbi:MAG: hypothetical protein ACLVJH_12140 [Faecalibacterium prausnitzii]
MGPGGVFGDVLGGSSLSSPVTVVACGPLRGAAGALRAASAAAADPARQRVLQNLVRTISDKYFLLSRRVDLLLLKSLRAKVCGLPAQRGRARTTA